ncbi:MAG: SUMF1/EgtB/PvdO family nonheme iron enzyme [Wenzhouxiangella sp.]|nr:SUMF1/EgtB/PvdO family nonheme iron enzyme [Wenzhouxiangella sp.]
MRVAPADGACTRTPADNGWGRGERPVMNVDRVDMQQFIDWLSQKTGKPYRLPSESEWDDALRARQEIGRRPGRDGPLQ